MTTEPKKAKSTVIACYLKVTRTINGEPSAADMEQVFAKARTMRDQLKDQGTVEGTVMVGNQRFKL